MNREMLEAPFPKELVKTRKGAFGQMLSYVEGIEYVRRLNDVFAASWSFEVVSHQILENEVIVLGKLSVDGVVKQAFGGSQVTRTRDEGELVSLADDLKASATDSLKKCCSLLGVGLYLYADENGKGEKQNSGRRQHTRTSAVKGHGDNGNNRISARQLSTIWSLARKAGYSSEDIRRRSIECFGAPPERISRPDASSLISELGNTAFNGGSHGSKPCSR